ELLVTHRTITFCHFSWSTSNLNLNRRHLNLLHLSSRVWRHHYAVIGHRRLVPTRMSPTRRRITTTGPSHRRRRIPTRGTTGNRSQCVPTRRLLLIDCIPIGATLRRGRGRIGTTACSSTFCRLIPTSTFTRRSSSSRL